MGSAASILDNEFEWNPTVFPKLGVKLSFIEEFYAVCGGRSNLEGLTTSDVCEQYVKAILTNASQTSLCELLQSQGHPAVGIATVFISHAWKYKFLDVISALQSHLQDSPDVVIWFDLFSNNQHKATSLDYEWWSTTFKSAIAQFGHTIMVLSPWNDPIPYQRAWCIFEAYCTAVTNSKFEIAMSAEERRNFLSDIAQDTNSKVDKMLATIQAERSECYKSEDREKIFSAIKQSVGFNHINSMIFEQYRDWVISVTSLALDQCDLADRSSLLQTLGLLYQGQGKYELALPLLKECMVQYKVVHGVAHPDTLSSMNNLANLHNDQGNFSEAQPLYEVCLAQYREMMGVAHPNTLSAMNNLAAMYRIQCNYSDALSLYEECLAQYKVVLGVAHPNTLSAMSNLASLYNVQGNYPLALSLYEECLTQRKVVLGASHPDTLGSINNLANLYKVQGNYSLALPLFEECLAQYKVVLGVSHPNTLNAMSNLANLYSVQGDYSQALPLCEECLAQRKLLLGVAHPNTLSAMSNLANLYNIRGDHSLALPLFEECLAQYKWCWAWLTPTPLVL